jgi:hypothetical protein
MYLDMPYSEWIKRFQGRLATDICCNLKQEKSGTMCGRECIRYVRETKRGYKSDWWQFWMAQQSGLPADTLGALVRFADFPQVPGLPLRAVRRNFSFYKNGQAFYGNPVNILETTNIDRKPMPAGLLKLPTGYRKVDDELELLLADDGQGMDGMEGLFGEAQPRQAAAKSVHKPAR